MSPCIHGMIFEDIVSINIYFNIYIYIYRACIQIQPTCKSRFFETCCGELAMGQIASMRGVSTAAMALLSHTEG